MRYLLVTLLLAASRPADAGLMYFGIVCGLGSDPDAAAVTLNERMASLAGIYDTRHQSLDVLHHDDQVLMCSRVSRELGRSREAADPSEARCLSASSMAEMASGSGQFFPGTRRGQLTALSLSADRSGTIWACSLVTPAPYTRRRDR